MNDSNIGTLDNRDLRIPLLVSNYMVRLVVGGSRRYKLDFESEGPRNDLNVCKMLYSKHKIPRKVYNTIESMLSRKSEPPSRRAWKTIYITTQLMRVCLSTIQ